MKRFSSRVSGSAMVATLILGLLASGSVLVVLAYASHSSTLTRRALDYQRARLAAEAGLDYGRSRLVELLRQYQFSLTQSQMDAVINDLPTPPAMGGYAYTAPNGQVAFRINIDSAEQTGTIPSGSVAVGSLGTYQYFTITCGALNPQSGVGAVLKEEVQALSVVLNRFGVFYDEDLEILPGPPMEFHGPVHSNEDMYLGGPLDFYDKLTAAGDILHQRKDTGEVKGEVYITNEDNQLTSMQQGFAPIDSLHSQWMTDALDLWDGNVLSGAHGISELDPPINPLDNPRAIIEAPLAVGDPNYREETEKEKFANKAALTIHVDALGNVTVTDYYGNDVTAEFDNVTPVEDGSFNGEPLHEKNDDGSYELNGAGSVDTSQAFFDGREDAVIAPVDIYIDNFLDAYPELYSGLTYGISEGRGVVYVTREDPDGPGGVQPAVRLRNGTELPDFGLTFASDLPVYIEGDYNTDGGTKPALVTGDAVTLLSVDWQDARSASGIGTRLADHTAYNTVIMTGNTETIPGVQYNGGLENVLRFLENWSGKTVTYRGSIIDLWFSQIADGPWEYGDYYTAPNRNWGYDPIYLTEAPPGVPRVFGLEQLAWDESTWEAEDWD